MATISTEREPHLLIWPFLTRLPVIKEVVKTDRQASPGRDGRILVISQGKRKKSTQ